jgi:cytochrome c peroxidase
VLKNKSLCLVYLFVLILVISFSENDSKGVFLSPETAAAAYAAAYEKPAEEELPPPPPLGLGEVPIPEDNPMTRPKIELGRMLFFEKRISADGTVACVTCHMPRRGFTNGRQYGIGIGGRIGLRNTPTVINAAYNDVQFWDGRAGSLEEQAKGPIQHPAEMGATEEHIARVLGSVPAYRAAFRKAFGTEKITLDLAAKAIATFERTILSGGSPFDRWKYGGEKNAMSPAGVRGFAVFRNKGKCVKCHLVDEFSAPFTDNKFHNIGVGIHAKPPHIGREKVSKSPRDRGKFKTPTLREVSRTAPYMHDGNMNTLEEVIDYFDKGALLNSNLDPDIKPLKLTPGEKKDLIAFLRSLNGSLPQFAAPGKNP